MDEKKVAIHPTSKLAEDDRLRQRENLARQMRTNQVMREQARDNINAIKTIDEIEQINLALQGEKDQAGEPIPLDPDIRRQLEARATIKFKLLDKVLPNLKASESLNLTMGDHNITVTQKVSNVELAARLQEWRKNHGAGHIMREEAKGESCVEATFSEVEESDFDFL